MGKAAIPQDSHKNIESQSVCRLANVVLSDMTMQAGRITSTATPPPHGMACLHDSRSHEPSPPPISAPSLSVATKSAMKLDEAITRHGAQWATHPARLAAGL